MVKSQEALRCDSSDNFTYQDRIFDNEMNHLATVTDEHYENMMYREALKTGFYDLQTARDRYRDITAAGDGMNWVLVRKFIEVRVYEWKGKVHIFCIRYRISDLGGGTLSSVSKRGGQSTEFCLELTKSRRDKPELRDCINPPPPPPP